MAGALCVVLEVVLSLQETFLETLCRTPFGFWSGDSEATGARRGFLRGLQDRPKTLQGIDWAGTQAWQRRLRRG